MGTRKNYQRVLIEACYLVGGEEVLALRLHRPVGQVIDWLLDIEPIPVTAFLQAVDICIEAKERHSADVDAYLSAIRCRAGR